MNCGILIIVRISYINTPMLYSAFYLGVTLTFHQTLSKKVQNEMRNINPCIFHFGFSRPKIRVRVRFGSGLELGLDLNQNYLQ